MSDPDVVIVGAGAAGLSAARTLRAAGRSVVVLEAHDGIGGRARTSAPDGLNGARIDEGATWLHQVDRNPLAALARMAGDTLHPAHLGGRRLFDGMADVTQAQEAAYEHAEAVWHDLAEELAGGPDLALSAAGDRWLGDDRWLGNIEHWQGAIIAAADADLLSLRDWQANQLDEGDLRPEIGVGALLTRHFGASAGPVRCGVAVRTVDWSVPGQVCVGTSSGTVRASACIVTVSTGVLRDGRIGFVPGLPAEILGALDGLPMGLLSKAAFRARDGFGFAVPDDTLLEQRLESRGGKSMLLSVRPDGSPLVTGFLGGRHAWSLVGREADTLALVRERLAALIGVEAQGGLVGGGFVSRWGDDPLFLGSYAYARPGHAGARAALGVPFADGRVVLAGEACCTDGLAGTVGGAIGDGERAARQVVAGLSGDRITGDGVGRG